MPLSSLGLHRKKQRHLSGRLFCHPPLLTGWHMVLGGIPLLALAAWQEGGEAPARLAQLTGGECVLGRELYWERC